MNDVIKFAKWLYPGMKIKRWIFLSAFGLIMVGIGSAQFLLGRSIFDRIFGGATLAAGIFFVISGIRQMVRSLVDVVMPEHENQLVDLVYQRRYLEKGQKIVAIGGGTGLSVLLHGIKEHTANITAIVTVTDDGGSSGRLREDLDVLPPGDIRNCLVALADSEQLLQQLFQFRFQNGSELKGHNFGNLFITALSKVTGDFEKAVLESSRVLAIRGKVVPATVNKVVLIGKHADGSITEGETKIVEAKSPLEKLMLRPAGSRPTQSALDALAQADAIILGPGSLYTSVISNLLVADLVDAIATSPAVKIYVCNVMTQPGETDGFKASDHIKKIHEYSRPDIINICIVNSARIPDGLLTKYKLQNAYPVEVDKENITKLGCSAIEGQIINTQDYVRHDSGKLARIIMDLVEKYKK
ncbi:MAG: uridine diphosphate-N-acetylglucosamine-binding protein YvcK [Candidatus Omnitrophota bacterium]